MAVKNRVKDFLLRSLGKEISAYRLSKMTGIGYSTALRLLSNESWYPDRSTMETLCAFFDVQPGEFLYFEREEQ